MSSLRNDMFPHRKLRTWELAIELAKAVYKATEMFPGDEKFGMTAQLRRAGVSVASNIAEGAGRSSDQQYVRYLYMARGSLSEIDTQVELASELGYVKTAGRDYLDERIAAVSKKLNGLIKRINTDIERRKS